MADDLLTCLRPLHTRGDPGQVHRESTQFPDVIRKLLSVMKNSQMCCQLGSVTFTSSQLANAMGIKSTLGEEDWQQFQSNSTVEISSQ